MKQSIEQIKEQIKNLSYDSDYPAGIGGFTINIEHDPNPEDPRNWGSPFTMVCAHKRYNLGDEQLQYEGDGRAKMAQYFAGMAGIDFTSYWPHEETDKIDQIHYWIDQTILWLPLYLYDHSGITMKTTPFHSRWDSGQVGFIYISREDARKEYNWKRISRRREKEIYKYMQADVGEYDQYIRGDVYCYSIEQNGEHIDSLSGIYGAWDDNYILERITDSIESILTS